MADLVAGDTQTELVVTFLNQETGLPVPLAGLEATYRWSTHAAGARSRTVERTMTKDQPETLGRARYRFAAGELVAGIMEGEARLTDGSGAQVTGLEVIRKVVRARV